MKKLIALITIIFLICLGCSEPKQPDTITIRVEDTTKLALIKDLYILQQNLQQIYETDSISNDELIRNRAIIDTLILKSLDFKDQSLDLSMMRVRYNRMTVRYEKKLDTILKHNEYLNFQYAVSQQKLDNERKNYNKLKRHASKTQDSLRKATTMTIENIEIVGIGSSLFDTDYITNKSNKIKHVKFTALLPQNKRDGTYTITIKIYSTDSKEIMKQDKTVIYRGSEIPILLTLGKSASFQKGKHAVKVLLDNVVVFDTILDVI